MHLIQAGVNLIYIRDISRPRRPVHHRDLRPRADRRPNEKPSKLPTPDVVTDDPPEWNQDPGLLDWLTNL